MSKLNESPSHNKEEKSSKLVIISKNRIESAKNRVNLLTLKEGELKLTVQLNNDSLNKNSINNAVKSIKKTLLINSKSFGSLHEQSTNNYFKKKNILKTPSIKKEKYVRKSPYLKKIDNINIETLRSYNLMKSTENEKNYVGENNNNINKLETIIPIEINTEENLKPKIKEKNTDNDNDIKINNIETLEIKIGNNNPKNENNNNNNAIVGGFISRDYFNNTKNIIKSKNENYNDVLKSEEMLQLNSYSNRLKNNNNIIKSNNINEKNNQQSDIAAKSISEQEQDYKKIVSKLVLDSLRISEPEKIKENNKGQRLITEYDEQNNKNDENDLISESKSSKTIEVDENYEESEEEVNKPNNNNINNKITDEEKKENNLKIKKEFINKNKKENIQNLKQINSLTLRNLNAINYIYKTCSICEHALPIAKLFVAECQQHFLCRKCAKNYFEDIIENGIKEMLCPFIKCGQPVDLESLKYIISKEHYNILINNAKNIEKSHTKFYNTKLKTSFDQENLQPYIKKHVLDINTNKSFFEYNNIKDVYCPNCFTDSLFSKTNTFFYKCLNCECKRCKYCLKDFGVRHMDTVSPEHCKVYYRYDEEEAKNSKIFVTFFLQLFFVFATYYLSFVGSFLFWRKLFYYLLCLKKGSNAFLYIISYLFTFIFFLITFPFILFFLPYFPSILALSDY